MCHGVGDRGSKTTLRRGGKLCFTPRLRSEPFSSATEHVILVRLWKHSDGSSSAVAGEPTEKTSCPPAPREYGIVPSTDNRNGLRDPLSHGEEGR